MGTDWTSLSVRFGEPAWLALAVLVVPAVWGSVRWLTAMSVARRWTAAATRTAVVALAALALAGATAVRETDRMCVIAVVDRSESVRRFAEAGIDDRVRTFLTTATAKREREDMVGVVVFDGVARALATPTASRDGLARLGEAAGKGVGGGGGFGGNGSGGDGVGSGGRSGTDIEKALGLAEAMFPPDAARRIVLVSDGVETRGSALRAVRAGTRVDGVVIDYEVRDEVAVESVEGPAVAQAGATAGVRITLVSSGRASGTLRLTHEGTEVDLDPRAEGSGRRVSLEPGRNVVNVEVPLGPGRLHRLEAFFEADAGERSDTIMANNRAESFVITPGKGSVLVVVGENEEDLGGAGGSTAARDGDSAIAAALQRAGVSAKSIPAREFPVDLLALEAFDLIVLENVAADAIAQESHRALVEYVERLGGGLVMVGGRSSFGAGLWKGSELEAILPVRLDLPERLIAPAAALVIVLDNSGSMRQSVGGSTRNQQEVAAEGAALAVRSLDRSDEVGVVVFNSDYDVLVPLEKNRDPETTARLIRGVGSNGGTNIGPALQAAARMLEDSDATVKHIVLLTDGKSMDAGELPEIADAIGAKGIAVSSIAVGDRADMGSLADVSKRTGGRMYPVADPNLLPRVFLRAVRVVRTPLIREGAFTPVIVGVGSELTTGLSRPPKELTGLTLTQARGEATITTAMVHPNGEPLLAHWNVGLGQVAAFTSDASEWAAAWRESGEFAEFWTRMARSVSRPPTDRSMALTSRVEGDRVALRLDATDGGGAPLDGLSVEAAVYSPAGERRTVRLAQVGPGTYSGSVEADEEGNYVAVVSPRLGARRLAPVTGGATRGGGEEFLSLRSDAGLVRRLAEQSGGRVFGLESTDADVFAREGDEAVESRRPLRGELLAWLLVAMVLDVATRRVAWDRWLVRGRAAGGAAASAAGASIMDRLRGSSAAEAGTGAGNGAAAGAERTASTRSAAGAPGADISLGEEDAKRIVREQAERRRREKAERRAGARADSERGAARVGVDPARTDEEGRASETRGTDADGAEDAGAEPESALMAAKRRARARFDEEHPKSGF